MAEIVFRYEFSSPYSYVAAHRVDALLGQAVRWEPILFGALVRSIGKVPWSLQPGEARDRRMRECEERAAALGLPLVWPRDWPLGTYSVLAARAAVVAEELGAQRAFALQAFRLGLGEGRDLTDPAVVREAALAAGLDPDLVERGVARPEIKARLREATDRAVTLGVTGVPTVTLPDGTHVWGEDRLDDAAEIARARGLVQP